MIPEHLAYLTLLFGVPLNLYVTVRLWYLSRLASETKVLRERAIVSTGVFILVVLFAIVFMNNDMVVPAVGFDDTKYITRLAVLGLAIIPASYWLWLYRDHGSHR